MFWDLRFRTRIKVGIKVIGVRIRVRGWDYD